MLITRSIARSGSLLTSLRAGRSRRASANRSGPVLGLVESCESRVLLSASTGGAAAQDAGAAVQPGLFPLNGDIASFNVQTGYWWIGISNGTQFSNVQGPRWSTSVHWHTYSGDFNGDGKTDVIGRQAETGQWWVGINNGSTFVTSYFGKWGTDASANWNYVQVGDLNGDGKDDIIGMDTNGQWWGALSDGSRFNTQYFGRWNPTAWATVQAADFDGDGKTDILGLQSATGQIWLGLSSGTTFQNMYVGRWSASAGWHNPLLGDFTGMGTANVLAQTSTGAWYFGGGDAMGHLMTVSCGSTTQQTAMGAPIVADVNGDGLDDLIVTADSGKVYVKQSTGTGMTAPAQWGTVPAGSTLVTAADVNADGKGDLVYFNKTTGAFTVLVSSGQPFFVPQAFGSWTAGSPGGFEQFFACNFGI